MSGQKFQFALDQFNTFGDLLKYLRRRAGLTQRELAISVGYSHAQISRLEQNQRVPDMAMVAAQFVPALDLEDEPQVAARLVELSGTVFRLETPVSGLAPFKGLQYFEEADAGLFFGRETLTDQLVERMRLMLTGAVPYRFLAVVGASGSGKSSLIRAGLVPALRRRQPFRGWQIHCVTPTSQPIQILEGILDQINSMGGMSGPRANSRLLLVIDQFEELFTLCPEETQRQAFIDRLMSAAQEPGGQVYVVSALRADFYSRCAPYPVLREALAAQQEYIGPMKIEDLRRAIEEPARRGDWAIETGLSEVLLKDVGAVGNQMPEPGSLPLLSHALLETWRRRSGRTLTVSGYLASGGVRGAIAETADVVYYDELDSDQREIARKLFLRLIQVSEEQGSTETRRRAGLSELVSWPEEQSTVRETLNRLADARLISVDHDVAELAHEALIREWPTLRGWLDNNREAILLHRHLTLAAEGWERQKREPGELYRGARLAQALAWINEHPGELSRLEQDFLAASEAQAVQEEAEREAQRRRELEIAQALVETEQRAAVQLRRRAFFLTAAFILAILMAAAALYQGELARRSAVEAQTERRIASARELAAASINNLESDPERSILLALQSAATTRQVDGIVLLETEEALHRALLASHVRMTLSGHNQWVLSTAFSPDGKRLAAIGRDGLILVWDADSGQELLRLPGETDITDEIGMQRLAFSPDGSQLAAGDGTRVKIRDAASGEMIRELSGHSGNVWAVAYSADQRMLASGSSDGGVRIWDVQTGALIHALSGHTLAVEGLAFRPGGDQLATGGDDQSVRIWDLATGEVAFVRSEFTGEILRVDYSPDGTLLAAAGTDGLFVWEADAVDGPEMFAIPEEVADVSFSPDGERLAGVSGSTAKLWDARTGRELIRLAGHSGWVNDPSFSPDGSRLATASFDQTVKVWSILPGQEGTLLDGLGWRVVYSPDGTHFATAGENGTAKIWEAVTGQELLTLVGHSAPVMGVAYRPDGKRLATASLDQTAKVWDADSGELLLTLSGHEVGVRDVAYSPDGRWITTAGFDQTALIWDAQTGQVMQVLTGHDGLVLGVAFSPDGTRLATSSTDKTAKLWEVSTGRLLATLSGHLDPIPDIAFHPDGTKVVTGSQDGTAKIWDAQTGEEILTLSGHASEIQSVAYSPDGSLIATGSGDTSAKVWDARTGQELHNLPGSQGGITSVAFDPLAGSKRLVVGSTDGTVRVFLLDIDELLTLAQTRVTRALTEWECQKYLHLEQCTAAEE